MGKSNINSRRQFLQKLLAATAVAGLYPYLDKAKPYYKELQFFKNLSEWPAEW